MRLGLFGIFGLIKKSLPPLQGFGIDCISNQALRTLLVYQAPSGLNQSGTQNSEHGILDDPTSQLEINL